jgi:hypothetical protein
VTLDVVPLITVYAKVKDDRDRVTSVGKVILTLPPLEITLSGVREIV